MISALWLFAMFPAGIITFIVGIVIGASRDYEAYTGHDAEI
jgi:hypothetical protein